MKKDPSWGGQTLPPAIMEASSVISCSAAAARTWVGQLGSAWLHRRFFEVLERLWGRGWADFCPFCIAGAEKVVRGLLGGWLELLSGLCRLGILCLSNDALVHLFSAKMCR